MLPMLLREFALLESEIETQAENDLSALKKMGYATMQYVDICSAKELVTNYDYSNVCFIYIHKQEEEVDTDKIKKELGLRECINAFNMLYIYRNAEQY